MKIYLIFSGLIVLLSNLSGVVSFPDNKGKIIIQEDDFAIRQIENPNSSIKTAEAIFSVNSNPEKCFKIISDYKNYPGTMPNITEVKFVSKNDKGSIYDFVFEVAFIDVEYTLLLSDKKTDDTYSIEWSYIKGDLNDSHGSWLIEPDSLNAGNSMVHYSVYLDSGSFLPGWLQNKLTAGSIPDMIESIRLAVVK